MGQESPMEAGGRTGERSHRRIGSSPSATRPGHLSSENAHARRTCALIIRASSRAAYRDSMTTDAGGNPSAVAVRVVFPAFSVDRITAKQRPLNALCSVALNDSLLD
jgi:hypothetical protein